MAEITLSLKEVFLPIATLLLGIYLGQRGKLILVKRSEFNELVRETYFSLKKQIESSPLSSVIFNEERVELYIHPWKRGLFRRRVKEYTKYYNKISTYNSSTGVVTKNETELEAHIRASKKLLPFFKPR